MNTNNTGVDNLERAQLIEELLKGVSGCLGLEKLIEISVNKYADIGEVWNILKIVQHNSKILLNAKLYMTIPSELIRLKYSGPLLEEKLSKNELESVIEAELESLRTYKYKLFEI